ncbi:thymidylate kinase [Sulfodiicoccus acidiphilus]|uniref:Probable thymidylate kinase n=1 Tax=Sulfodiicoccus acidiphilus TaxID=1670455 RepID=A0A348B2T5_9CREN|nr:dTMP kinase [Sulfodiicoccus acidiphilus]BBD72487.1 thymidylate kinase [Sulfodiicoccus acidiphilus]GGT96771.1 thymidylate kinase [Sulfodiicoccus acidiphilus]
MKLVAIEGIDGAGKTTLANSLRPKLVGYKVIVTSEPFDVQISSLIARSGWEDGILLTLLFAADRAIHVNWMRAQNADLILTDRYFYSSMAYQSSLGIDQEWIAEVNSYFPKPDLTVLLDLDPSVARSRLKRDTYDFRRKWDSLPNVRKRYLELASKFGFLVVDASKPQEEVLNAVLPHILNLLGRSQEVS